MNIGSLYTVKKWFWLLFPTKEIATSTAPIDAAAAMARPPVHTADYWSRQLKCEVTYFSPDSIIVFLEKDRKYKKVLTSDGKIGWTWFSETYNECFEELKAEP